MPTDKQLHILRHSLGLTRSKEAYRNHFVTGEGSDDHLDCMALVQAGLMTRRPGNVLSGGNDIFYVTDAGKAAAGVALPRVTQPRDCPCGIDCFRSDCTDTRCGIWADREKAAFGVRASDEPLSDLILRLHREGYTADEIAAELADCGRASEADAAGICIGTVIEDAPGVQGAEAGRAAAQRMLTDPGMRRILQNLKDSDGVNIPDGAQR